MTNFERIKKSLNSSGSLLNGFAHTFASKGFMILSSILITPVLSRLFLPEAYGHMSVFSRISAFFIVISSFGYTDSLLTTESKKEFDYLFITALISITGTSLLFLIFSQPILFYYTGNSYTSTFLLILWFGILTTALNNLFAKIIFDENQFQLGSRITISFVVINRAIGLIIGLLGGYKYGLVVAETAGRTFNLFTYQDKLKSLSFEKFKLFDYRKAWILIKKYRQYPFAYLPSRILNSTFYLIIVAIISRRYGLDHLGQYSLAAGLLNLPINLLGNSLSPVLMRKAKDIGKDARDKLGSQLYLYFLAFLIPILVFGYFCDTLFVLFLGDNWVIGAEVAKILIITILPILIATTLNGFILLNKNEKGLLIAETLKVISLLSILYWFEMNFLQFIILVSVIEVLVCTLKINITQYRFSDFLKSFCILALTTLYLYLIIK